MPAPRWETGLSTTSAYSMQVKSSIWEFLKRMAKDRRRPSDTKDKSKPVARRSPNTSANRDGAIANAWCWSARHHARTALNQIIGEITCCMEPLRAFGRGGGAMIERSVAFKRWKRGRKGHAGEGESFQDRMTDGAAPVWRFAESTPLCAVKYIIYICTIRVGLGRGCDASWVRLAHSAGVVVSLRYCQVGVETWKVSMFDTISQQVVVLGLIS
ncbi:hypothetical protein GN958_ATG09370, partial [Phytophthora infestans]